MSRTTDALVKAMECPDSLTPAERRFVGLDGPRSPEELHLEAREQGHPCDCPDCAPELWEARTEAPHRAE